MKKNIVRATVCTALAAFMVFAGWVDNQNPNEDDYSTTNPLFQYIGATFFLATLFFVLSFLFRKK